MNGRHINIRSSVCMGLGRTRFDSIREDRAGQKFERLLKDWHQREAS